MAIQQKMLKQDLVFWRLIGKDRFGEEVYEQPVQMKCRWEEKQEEFFDAETNQKVISNGIVYVPQDMKVGDVLMLGTLDDIKDFDKPISPENGTQCRRIRSWSSLPNLRNVAKKRLRIAVV